MKSQINPALGIVANSASTPAAQYIRRSTDHQKYSTENQSEANHAYANRRAFNIVRTYVDDGISGLTFERRGALQQLISDVQTGIADYKAILVYDVSRWGRPQDVDEAAYYEFLCKRAGIGVYYCAEQFENDGSLISAVLKNLKRAMAGEYSRELSVKVFAGQRRVMGLGYRLGGVAGYGYRRILVDQKGTFKCALEPGEWKSIATDRVLLVPGPVEEVEVVRWMFSEFVGGMTEHEIAGDLNERGLLNHIGNKWLGPTVRTLLKNEKYIGNHLWNRRSFKLRRKYVRNRPDTWVRVENAFPAIVERSVFQTVQEIFRTRANRTYRGRPRGLSDAEMLERLSRVFRVHGRLSHSIIDHSEGLPSHSSYQMWFGSLRNAYTLVGFRVDANQHGATLNDRKRLKDTRGVRDEDLLNALRRLLQSRGYLSGSVIDQSNMTPSRKSYGRRFGSLSRAYELIGYERPYKTRPSLSDKEMLRGLKILLCDRGCLSRRIIDEADHLPSSHTYYGRFGSLAHAYELIGYTPETKSYTVTRGISNQALLDKLIVLLRERGRLSSRMIDQTTNMPSRSLYVNRFGSMRQAYALVGYSPAILSKPRNERGK